MSADDHHKSRSNALVPRPGSDLGETGRRTHPVIARMTRDVLVRAESHRLSTARYHLGQYVLREPDYRQILDWANALGKAPEWVLEQLADSRLDLESWRESMLEQLVNRLNLGSWDDSALIQMLDKLESESRKKSKSITLLIEDGTIRSLVWDFDRLPIIPVFLRNGLSIRVLGLQQF